MYVVMFYVWISVCREGRGWAALGPLLGPSWAALGPPLLLGCSWAVLGPPGPSLGPFWGPGPLLGARPRGAPGGSWLLLGAPGCSWLLLAARGRSWPVLAAPGRSWPLVGALLAAPAGLLAASGFVISFRDKYHFQVRMRTRMYKSMYLCII